MANQIKVGDKAPDFTLPDTDLKPRSLKDFLGHKVVLAFFVGAFTSVCTKEMCAFRDSMARLIDLKAQVIGISVNDPFSNQAFAEKNRLPFPILSDYNRQVIKTYGVETPDFEQVSAAIFQNAVNAFDEFESVLDFYVVETAKQSVVLAEPQQTLLLADFFP